MIKCPNCGKRNPGGNKFCGECGTNLIEAERYCPNCDKMHNEGEKFCTQCGTRLVNKTEYWQIKRELERKKKLYDRGCDQLIDEHLTV